MVKAHHTLNSLDLHVYALNLPFLKLYGQIVVVVSAIFYCARCYAERVIAMASRLSVHLSVTLLCLNHIGWLAQGVLSLMISTSNSKKNTPK